MRHVALLVVAALSLAACGGDQVEGGVEDLTTVTADPGATGAECVLDEVDGDLNLYNFADHIDPELISSFEEQYAVDVIEDFYESNERLLAQVQAGAVYDLIVPSDYMIEIMLEDEMLAPINVDAVPNLSNLRQRFTDLTYDPGPGHSVAYLYRTTGLGVDLDDVGEDVDPSWGLLFDPELTTGLSGGVSVLDDPREAMGAALMYLGYSLNDTDLNHLREATETISSARDGIATFQSERPTDALLSGDVAVSHGYSNEMVVGMVEADDPEDFAYLIPEEGARLWIDNMAVPTDAEHPCTGFTFINYILRAENGAALTNWSHYGTPNQAALDFVDPLVAEFYAPTFEAEELEVIQDTGEYESNFADYLEEAKAD